MNLVMVSCARWTIVWSGISALVSLSTSSGHVGYLPSLLLREYEHAEGTFGIQQDILL